jgi:hypothetical protein
MAATHGHLQDYHMTQLQMYTAFLQNETLEIASAGHGGTLAPNLPLLAQVRPSQSALRLLHLRLR